MSRKESMRPETIYVARDLELFFSRRMLVVMQREVVMNWFRRVLCMGVLMGAVGGVYADTDITVYGVYWDGDDPGKGAGVRVRKSFLAFMAVEGRTGYVDFADSNTKVIPAEISVIGRLPTFISPYVGLGTGYYFVDSDRPGVNDFGGGFAQLGVDVSILWFGAMAEIRYYEMEESDWNGAAYNLGLFLQF